MKRALPGIGPYTAAAIAAIAFDRAETVMDGNVERVVARLFRVETPLPVSKPELFALAGRLTPKARPGDHAKAMMDLGATICTPKSPACGLCPLRAPCRARQAGLQADLPRKAARPAKPVRLGYAYLARRADGAWLLETRPDRGLLGGMQAWPCSDWSADPAEDPPLVADWRSAGLEVRHTFTHFHLRLTLRLADVATGAAPSRGAFVPRSAFRPAALPTVMRKAYDLAAPALDPD
jgi:A/G-specific adenine glycosylase